MGQTQLLLIVLSVIIVGIAVSVGIAQMGENSLTANRDAVATDCQRVIASSQQWYRKPTSLGGGGNTFTGLTLSKIGLGSSNQNGSYALTVSGPGNITVVGTGNETTDSGAAVQVTMDYFAANDSTAYSDNL